jgi:hypothetical protein
MHCRTFKDFQASVSNGKPFTVLFENAIINVKVVSGFNEGDLCMQWQHTKKPIVFTVAEVDRARRLVGYERDDRIVKTTIEYCVKIVDIK